MNSIYKKYNDAKDIGIANYIEENVADGDIKDKEGKTFIFLASNGSWQTKYLSLYEMLHDKYIAKYCAKLLLEDYIDQNYEIIKKVIDDAETPEEIHQILYKKLAFTKIVTVTVSSQLIGVALRNIVRDNEQYYFLRKPLESNRLKASPLLLRLSSYYSFDEEKQFREISTNDRVLIVNDVISTGNLVYSLLSKIEKRGASMKAVFSIADTRVPEKHLLQNTLGESINGARVEESPYHFGTLVQEKSFFSLVKRYGSGNEIRKFKRPYTGNSEIKRINPLLNTIVELETRHSEEKRILFPKPEDILKDAIIDEEHFKIGHFRQNLSHNGYLTDMHHVFSTDGDDSSGKKLLYAIKGRLDSFLSEQPISNDILNSIIQNFDWLKQTNSLDEEFKKAHSATLKFTQQFKSKHKNDTVNFKPDYIFFPPFSGIEQLEEQTLHECFGTPIENIICLQRFDTSKGWRFPFPAKWYNHLTKDKTILILDSGSLTGESLVQLVDSVTFLDVKDITVLSTITRIDDFYREFYSRIKFTKVKTLQVDENITSEQRLHQHEHIVPLNIVFGTNLNIPVFPSKISCPFCEELAELKYYVDKAIITEPSDYTLAYIKDRQNELREINLEGLESYTIPYYFPVVKLNGVAQLEKVDSLEVFLMRDRIGRIDSYRFFKDYFYYFDTLKTDIQNLGLHTKQNLRKIELVLSLILHEPKLFRTINDLLIDIREYCEELIDDVVFKKKLSVTELVYYWNEYALIRLSVVLFPSRFKKASTWTSVFEFSLSNKRALNYLSFLLWEGFLEKSKIITNQDYIDIVSVFSDDLDNNNSNDSLIFSNRDFRKIIKGITNKFAITKVKSLNDAYFNLRKFFFGQTSSSSHNEFIKSLTKFESLVKNVEKTDEDIPSMLNLAESISNYLYVGVLENLTYIKNNDKVKKYHKLNYDTFFGSKGVYSELVDLLKFINVIIGDQNKIISNQEFPRLLQLFEVTNEFYIHYLHESSIFNRYCKEYKADFLNVFSSSFSTSSEIIRANVDNKTIIVCDTVIMSVDLVIGKLSIKDALIEFNKLEVDDTVYLCITKTFLEKLIDEIFINALKHSPGDTVDVDIYIYKLETSIVLRFHQNVIRADYSNPETIYAILQEFCGNGNVHISDDENGYTIEAIFNTDNLKLLN